MQALPTLMPGFDKEVAKLAQRVLINPRNIDYHTGVLATKVTPGAPLHRPCSLQPSATTTWPAHCKTFHCWAFCCWLVDPTTL